jgi:hypothetical protein
VGVFGPAPGACWCGMHACALDLTHMLHICRHVCVRRAGFQQVYVHVCTLRMYVCRMRKRPQHVCVSCIHSFPDMQRLNAYMFRTAFQLAHAFVTFLASPNACNNCNMKFSEAVILSQACTTWSVTCSIHVVMLTCSATSNTCDFPAFDASSAS